MEIQTVDLLHRFAPFILATGKQPQWNLQRILEGLIIAGITGAITMYGVQKSQEVQMAAIRSDLVQLRADMQQRITDVSASVRENTAMLNARNDRIEGKLDGHISRGVR